MIAGNPRPNSRARLRQDPRTRPVEGVRHRIINPDPDKKYVGVHKGSQDGITATVDDYLDMGYEVVIYTKDGTKMSGRNCKEGEPVEWMGHVLMSIDKERAAEIERVGPYGDSGQERADRIEERMVDKRGGVDGFRGMHGNAARHGFAIENQTGSPEPERPL